MAKSTADQEARVIALERLVDNLLGRLMTMAGEVAVAKRLAEDALKIGQETSAVIKAAQGMMANEAADDGGFSALPPEMMGMGGSLESEAKDI